MKQAFKLLGGSMLVYVVVVACSGTTAGDPDASAGTSGSRLKTERYVGDDGSTAIAGMHDTQLDLDCAFMKASDGSMRCLPGVGASVLHDFDDAQCTHAVVLVGSACPPPPYVLVPSTTCGATTFSVYPVPTTQTTKTYYFMSEAQGCLQMSPEPGLYEAGSEMPPSQFVSATVQTDS